MEHGPISRDEDMPLRVGLSFPRMEEARTRYIQAVSYELEFPPLRWLRDRVVPRLVELLDASDSGKKPHSGGE